MHPGWPVLSSPPRSPLSPQEALLVALKSLPSGTLLNVAGFGADIKPLFPSSRLCSNVSAAGQSPPPAPLRPRSCGFPAWGRGRRAGGPLQSRLSMRAGDAAACLRVPRRAAGRRGQHQPAGSPGLGAGTAPPPWVPPPALPLHRHGGRQHGQDPPAGAQAGQHRQVWHRHRGGFTVLLMSPGLFPLISPSAAPHLASTSPEGVVHP